jgi:hypothetical protein
MVAANEELEDRGTNFLLGVSINDVSIKNLEQDLGKNT